MTEKQFELKVLKFIKDHDLFEISDRLLIAVSGGSDSLCLLLLLAKWAKHWKWQIKVAYFDHGLRKSSYKEAKFVKEYARKLGFHFISSKGDSVKKKEEGFSIEEAARNLRYAFLKKEALRFKAKIVVAHHINDQIETFFIQLLKGSGLGGLSGMKSKTKKMIRPLLCVTKKEILEYLKHKNIRFKQDETNIETMYLRNRIRLKLIPFLKEEFPEWNVEKTLPKMMTILKDEHDFLNSLTEKRSKSFSGQIQISAFQQLPIALQRRIIKNTLERFSIMRNFTSSHVEESRKLFFNPVSHKKLVLPEGIRIEKLKKAVFFSKTL